jgi:hypothetical protein
MSPSGDSDLQGRRNRKCKGEDDLQNHNILLAFNKNLSYERTAPLILNLGTSVNDGQLYELQLYPHRNNPSMYLLACWPGPKACLHALEYSKLLNQPGNESRSLGRPVRELVNTHWTIPAFCRTCKVKRLWCKSNKWRRFYLSSDQGYGTVKTPFQTSSEAERHPQRWQKWGDVPPHRLRVTNLQLRC